MNGGLEPIGYGLAGFTYLILTALILTSFRGRLMGHLLAAATFLTAVWGFVLSTNASGTALTPSQIFRVEMLHDGIWFVFFAALLSGSAGFGRNWIVRYGGIILAGMLLILAPVLESAGDPAIGNPAFDGLFVTGSILTSLGAMIVLEQIYRNARESQRRSLKFLCLGVGSIFLFDLVLYSIDVFSDTHSPSMWSARGYVIAMCAPLIGVAAHRSPSWSAGIFVSRQMIFYSVAAIGAGAYLLAIGFAGYYIRVTGGSWGPVAQVVLFSAAMITLLLFLFSDRSRARLRVFISKQFFDTRYDYREEWLRLIATLNDATGALPPHKRAIKALAQIVGSGSGLLWLKTDDLSDYECVAGWDTPAAGAVFGAGHSLVTFLQRTGWVVEIREYIDDRDRYAGLELSLEELAHKQPAFIVPLLHDSKLSGFVVISEPSAVSTLNYEDRDLLKTAGQQIASYLAQELYAERLAEGRQLEAFSRLTAYLMHDLKNVVAQQSLIVENAERHKGNPEFVDDALVTVAASVARMRKVIDHLHRASAIQPAQRVELGNLVKQAISQCEDRKPVPQANYIDKQLWLTGDRDRLTMALSHAIRNAQEATPAEGSVKVCLKYDEGLARIHIIDTGCGMDETFIRERLFRLFDSTKGTQGMGIGAYQIRDTIRSSGGDVRVKSTPGVGTELVLEFEIVT